jgi:hypothetical protein
MMTRSMARAAPISASSAVYDDLPRRGEDDLLRPAQTVLASVCGVDEGADVLVGYPELVPQLHVVAELVGVRGQVADLQHRELL